MGEGLFVCLSRFLSLRHPASPPACRRGRCLPHHQQPSCSSPFAGGALGVGLEIKLSLLTGSSKEEQCLAGWWGRAPHQHHRGHCTPPITLSRGCHCCQHLSSCIQGEILRFSAMSVLSQGLQTSVTREMPRAMSDGRAQCQALLEKPESQVLGARRRWPPE